MTTRLLTMLATVCLVLCALGTPVVAVAAESASTPTADQSQPVFGIVARGGSDQYNISIEMKPGDSRSLAVGIINAGQAPVTLRTYAANALTVPNGGFGAGDEKDAPAGPTTWLDYTPGTITLSPRQEQDRDLTISVPPDTAPGQYVAALIVQTKDSFPIPGSQTFRQIIRKAMRVMITVPGAVTPGFTLGAPTFSTATSVHSLVIPIANTGNVLIEPAGTLTVTTPDGKKVITGPIKLGKVYGGMSTIIQLSVPDQMPAGDYLVSLDLTDAETDASASIENAKATLAPPKEPATPEATPEPAFVVDPVSVTPSGNPVQFADVAATVTNNGPLIPTADVTLIVKRDGKEVERYPLAHNQALPTGQTKIAQRYIPASGWQPGDWTFQIVVSAVSIGNGAETILATVDVPGQITIP